MAKGKKYTYQPATWEARFLKIYGENGNVTNAAKGAGIDRRTVYARRKTHPHFAVLMDEAREDALELLELMARKRALETSDTLLIFLLKNLKPDTYGDKLRLSWDKETLVAGKRLEQLLGVPLLEAFTRMEAELVSNPTTPLH